MDTPKSEVTYVDVYMKHTGPKKGSETWKTVEEDKHFKIQIMLLPQFRISKEIATTAIQFSASFPGIKSFLRAKEVPRKCQFMSY